MYTLSAIGEDAVVQAAASRTPNHTLQAGAIMLLSAIPWVPVALGAWLGKGYGKKYGKKRGALIGASIGAGASLLFLRHASKQMGGTIT